VAKALSVILLSLFGAQSSFACQKEQIVFAARQAGIFGSSTIIDVSSSRRGIIASIKSNRRRSSIQHRFPLFPGLEAVSYEQGGEAALRPSQK
jgi:hypothetical protein